MLRFLAVFLGLGVAIPTALLAPGCGPRGTPLGPAGGAAAGVDKILAASDLPAPMATALAADPLAVTIHRLSNGVTVYLSRDPAEPRISAWIAVRAGSRHDPADSTGLAHYLEHMLFKGTDELGTVDIAAERPHIERIAALYAELGATTDDGRRAKILAAIDDATQKAATYAIPNELDQLYARLGVRGVNAFTSNEQTVYIADLPKNRFEQWVRVEGERFKDPVFRLFYPELEAVYEEKNRSLDSPRWRVFEALDAALFPRHPYGTQPTIGVVEHLKSPAYGDMVAYFHRWYVANNMAIVLAGDIDAEVVLPLLEAQFGSLPVKPLPTALPGTIAPLSGRVERDITAGGEAAVFLGWQTVPVSHPDEPVLEVLDQLMDNASSGLINVNLVLTQKLPRAGSFANHLIEAGAWIMYGVARDGQSLDEVERLLLGVRDDLEAGRFTQAELDAIVLHTEMREMREAEANAFRVGKMAAAFVEHIPWPEAARRSEILRKVTREDVMRVARTYLGDDLVVVRRNKGEYQPPKVAKPAITPIPLDPTKTSPFARSIEAMEIRPIEPEWLAAGKHYTRAEIASGPMIAVANRRNQLFAVDYYFEVGSRRQPLLCLAFEFLEQSGTPSLSPAALKRKLYELGTTVTTGCDADWSRISIAGIDGNMAASIALVEEWLVGATAPPDTLGKLVANVLSRRKDDKDEPATVARALAEYTALGGDSSYLLAPPNSVIENATASELSALLAGLLDHRHHTFYFGPRAAADVDAQVALGQARRAVAPRPPTRYRTDSASRIFFAHEQVAKASVYVYFPRPSLPAADLGLSLLYSEYVGGNMGALVFQEIREARGLAYGAWARHRHGDRPRDGSAIIAGMDTQSDKTVEALRVLLGLLTDMPVQAERLATAKQTIQANFRASRIQPREVAGEVFEWQQLGFDADPRAGYARTIDAADRAALAAFAARHTRGPVFIAVVGDRTRIDLDALGAIAPVTEVTRDILFSY